MGIKLFQRQADPGATEFAPTEISLPAPDTLAPDTLPGGDGAAAPVSHAISAHSASTGHIGRYALKQQLGQGGLGTVHEAWDPLLSRTVAVKTLHFDLDAASRGTLDALFLNEARAAAGLNHPGIVTVFDAGLSEQGVYIAMERLTGRDLGEALAGGWAPTPAEAALLVRRVAEALAYAHAQGVVHCDVKPGNIFLGRRGKPKLLDFGIARVAHGADHAALDGLVAGSPHYLAPEQLDAGRIDARTDIYSLGVVFYELLAGRKAHDGAGLPQILAAVRAGTPTTVQVLRPDVPPALSSIALRAMAREPAARYGSALEMALDLRRWTDRQHGSAEPAPHKQHGTPAEPPPGAAPSASRRWLLGAGSAVLLGAAALLVVSLRQAEPSTPADRSAALRPLPVGVVPADPAAVVSAAAPAAPAPPPALPRPRPATVKPRAAAPAREPSSLAGAGAAAAVVTGTVQLAISPWGQVEVDGKPAGTTPPLARLTLPAGTHSITVRNEDFPPHTINVQVSGDKPVTVRHRFGP